MQTLLHLTQINAKDRASQTPLHRAATTGSVSLLQLLLNPPAGRPKTRLNTADRAGNTPMHLAMESGHGEATVVLIEAGADRERVSNGIPFLSFQVRS
jgi:26S proteasome non-ATPase regulatory subunit 10